MPGDAQDAERARLEANYRRLEMGLGLAARRARVSVSNEDPESSWGGYAGFDMLIPLQDGLSPLWSLQAGLEVLPLEDGTFVSFPIAIAYGFRTPLITGYAGGIFGAAFPVGESSSEGGMMFGALAALGADFGRVRLMAEGRWQVGLFRAGRTATVLSVGPLVAFSF